MPRINLRQLILGLTLISILLTLTNSIIASYRVQRDLLLQTTLESNQVYAAKLADSANIFLNEVMLQLRYSADAITGKRARDGMLYDQQALAEETHRLKVQSNTFNTVAIVDANGRIVVNAPRNPTFDGLLLESDGARQALRSRRPMISSMYTSQTGRRILLISMPLFSDDGQYHGYIGGTIFLDDANVMHSLLGQHYHQDGSTIYVVDQAGYLVYHINAARIGEHVLKNPAVQDVLAGNQGSMRTMNTQSQDVLVGYASIGLSGWGVLAQQPAQVVLERQRQLLLQTLLHTTPLLLLSLIGVWLVSQWISRPLAQLASHSKRMDDIELARSRITHTSAGYLEVALLKQSLLASLALLDDKIQTLRSESSTDQLTGLINRRGMDAQTNAWVNASRDFAVLLLDIDHFKLINDTYGHDTGDRVLKHLANLMQQNARSVDLVCRSGGEEFAIFLPDTSLDAARQIAERLRIRVKESPFPGGCRVTVSIGVALFPDTARTLAQVLKAADQALYRAKGNGRDKVELAAPPGGDMSAG